MGQKRCRCGYLSRRSLTASLKSEGSCVCSRLAIVLVWLSASCGGEMQRPGPGVVRAEPAAPVEPPVGADPVAGVPGRGIPAQPAAAEAADPRPREAEEAAESGGTGGSGSGGGSTGGADAATGGGRSRSRLRRPHDRLVPEAEAVPPERAKRPLGRWELWRSGMHLHRRGIKEGVAALGQEEGLEKSSAGETARCSSDGRLQTPADGMYKVPGGTTAGKERQASATGLRGWDSAARRPAAALVS